MLSAQQRDDWTNKGFFVLNEFAEPAQTDELLGAAETMADRVDAGESIGDACTVQEKALAAAGEPLSTQLSKTFRVRRTEPTFRRFAMRTRTLDLRSARCRATTSTASCRSPSSNCPAHWVSRSTAT